MHRAQTCAPSYASQWTTSHGVAQWLAPAVLPYRLRTPRPLAKPLAPPATASATQGVPHHVLVCAAVAAASQAGPTPRLEPCHSWGPSAEVPQVASVDHRRVNLAPPVYGLMACSPAQSSIPSRR